MTNPTVGRIVHYKSYGTPGGEYQPECRAAIVTGVNEFGNCDLAVLNPTGLFFDRNLPMDEEQSGGTWHWPCVQG